MLKTLLLSGFTKTKIKTTTPAIRFMESAIATSFARTPPLDMSTETAHSNTIFKFIECIDSSRAYKAIADLEALYGEVQTYWFNIKLHCNIGYI
jgi:hypothetical protein